VVAGEASGDALGARVLAALAPRCPDLSTEGVGGPRMQALGMCSLHPMERLSVMGLTGPLRRLPELLRLRRRLLRRFLSDPPDLFLGIDSPDFNLPLARALRRRGIPTAQLVSPSVWAWRPGRVETVSRSVDTVLCLFPFEPPLYARQAVSAVFVGHPLAEEIVPDPDPGAARAALDLPAGGQVLALLPGSRAGEVAAMADTFLRAARLLAGRIEGLSVVIPVAGPACRAALDPALENCGDLSLTLVEGRSREAMAAADAVLAASGTATLEAALLRRPLVVAYRMGALSWWVLSRLVHTPYVALPNIIAERQVAPELLQDAATPEALAHALEPLLADADARARAREDLAGTGTRLRGDFGAATAEALVGLAARGTVGD